MLNTNQQIKYDPINNLISLDWLDIVLPMEKVECDYIPTLADLINFEL